MTSDDETLSFVKDRVLWEPEEAAFFEYHCCQSHNSQDAELWYRSHQPVTVVRVENCDGLQFLEDGFLRRLDDAVPIAYKIRFEDGTEAGAFEDELYTSPKPFCEKYAPPPQEEINEVRARKLAEKSAAARPSPSINS